MALAGAAAGIGNAFSPSITSVVRNLSLAKQSSGYVIPGFASTEAIAPFALTMAFSISFVFRGLFGSEICHLVMSYLGPDYDFRPVTVLPGREGARAPTNISEITCRRNCFLLLVKSRW